MATVTNVRIGMRGPDRFERTLAYGAIILMLLVVVALFRGTARWGEMPPLVWAHIATVGIALALTPLQLLRRRGGTNHRLLGLIWSAALLATAIMSFWIRGVNGGRLSFIHLFSALTLVTVPWIVVAARTHRIEKHRRAVRALTLGAVLLAGYFTLLPTRLLGHWLFG